MIPRNHLCAIEKTLYSLKKNKCDEMNIHKTVVHDEFCGTVLPILLN